jgi:hypothetical protein
MRRTFPRKINPLIIVPLYILKKVAVYKLAERYGFPLVYRRLCEGIRSTVPKGGQPHVRNMIKASMRYPSTALNKLNDSETVLFLKTYAQYIADKSPNVPAFMVTLAHALRNNNGISNVWSLIFGSAPVPDPVPGPGSSAGTKTDTNADPGSGLRSGSGSTSLSNLKGEQQR